MKTEVSGSYDLDNRSEFAVIEHNFAAAMRQFYAQYRNDSKLQLLVGEISWAKNILIFSKCKDNLEKEFYIKMTKKFGWTKDVLLNHIENKSYEKYLLNQTNFDKTMGKDLAEEIYLI